MSETITLITQAQQGDRTATERLVTENTGLIWSIARRYFGRGVEPDDLFQLGCVGFLKAVEGFDTAYGTQFSTYAVPKIAGEIRRFLRDDGAVKVSRSIKERAAAIKKNARAPDRRLRPRADGIRAVGGYGAVARGDRQRRDGHQRRRIDPAADRRGGFFP